MNIMTLAQVKSLFFDNKNLKQTIFKNTFWLTAEMAISRLLKLVLIVYTARILGAAEYGKFTFALSFVSLFIIFSDLGLTTIVTREFARDKEKEKEFYSVLSLKTILTLGALILILTGSFFATPDESIRKVIWILGFYVLINGFYSIIYGFFYARQRMEYEALGEVLSALTVTGLGLFVIFKFPSVINLSYAYLFGTAVGLIFILIFFHFKFFPFKLCLRKETWKNFLRMSWPLALASVFSTLYANIDSVMMGHLNQITETGWYNASFRIINIALLPMGLIAGSFFPALSKFARPAEDMAADRIREMKENLQKVWDYDLKTMILIAVPLVTGGIALAPKIIDFVYGQGFLPSILAFQILMIMAGIIFLYRPFYEVLIASNQQKKTFWVAFTGATLNVILNLILIPNYSLYGAAAATVITHLSMFIMFFYLTAKYTFVEPFNFKFVFYLISAFLFSVLMYFAISQPFIYNQNVFFSILTGALVYSLLFVVLKFVPKYYFKIIR